MVNGLAGRWANARKLPTHFPQSPFRMSAPLPALDSYCTQSRMGEVESTRWAQADADEPSPRVVLGLGFPSQTLPANPDPINRPAINRPAPCVSGLGPLVDDGARVIANKRAEIRQPNGWDVGGVELLLFEKDLSERGRSEPLNSRGWVKARQYQIKCTTGLGRQRVGGIEARGIADLGPIRRPLAKARQLELQQKAAALGIPCPGGILPGWSIQLDYVRAESPRRTLWGILYYVLSSKSGQQIAVEHSLTIGSLEAQAAALSSAITEKHKNGPAAQTAYVDIRYHRMDVSRCLSSHHQPSARMLTFYSRRRCWHLTWSGFASSDLSGRPRHLYASSRSVALLPEQCSIRSCELYRQHSTAPTGGLWNCDYHRRCVNAPGSCLTSLEEKLNATTTPSPVSRLLNRSSRAPPSYAISIDNFGVQSIDGPPTRRYEISARRQFDKGDKMLGQHPGDSLRVRLGRGVRLDVVRLRAHSFLLQRHSRCTHSTDTRPGKHTDGMAGSKQTSTQMASL
ncbi:hypothetical protein BIW11_03621 [Tropilaelaps mercedesae]|uniref:Uncharacterized protein n=1 Tax=Tropilaelaps mercedesae TaxID=418985 RepID=A0A1V9XIS8_9ACAR|nr:hypothetical protein BIW11_03621 [Tropilaelaps mercedesae]